MAAVVAVPTLLLAACSDGSGNARGYTAELRHSFVRDCTTQGEAEPVCGCFYDSLAVSVPFDRFRRIDQRIKQGSAELPDDIVDLAASCDARFGTTTTID
jgi:hypothetical protein